MRALVLLVALLAAAPASARDSLVRLEWAPVGAVDRSDGSDTHYYVIERMTRAGWAEVIRIPHSPNVDDYERHRNIFGVDLPVAGLDPGRWRLTTVDVQGNVSAPVYLQPAPGSVPPEPSCSWAVQACEVPVWCERTCACDVVRRRLDEAREDLRAAGVLERPELLDQALCVTTIYLVGPERLVTPEGVQAAGAAAEGSILLATDMRAAAHELMHLYLYASGDRSSRSAQHDAWAKDQRLREIDRKHNVGGWRR